MEGARNQYLMDEEYVLSEEYGIKHIIICEVDGKLGTKPTSEIRATEDKCLTLQAEQDSASPNQFVDYQGK